MVGQKTMVMGIPVNPCVNGITKKDTEQITKIPMIEESVNGLDERVTVLENGGSGSSEERYNNVIESVNDISLSYEFLSDFKYLIPLSTLNTIQQEAIENGEYHDDLFDIVLDITTGEISGKIKNDIILCTYYGDINLNNYVKISILFKKDSPNNEVLQYLFTGFDSEIISKRQGSNFLFYQIRQELSPFEISGNEVNIFCSYLRFNNGSITQRMDLSTIDKYFNKDNDSWNGITGILIKENIYNSDFDQ